MALTSTSSTPEPKRADKPEPDASVAKTRVKPVSAAGATDPAVQQLVAEQQTAISNGDDDAIRDINKRLNELGYE
jgi:hypothetical protein